MPRLTKAGKWAPFAVGAIAVAVLSFWGASAQAQDEEATGLAVGDMAPGFSLKGSDGQTYTLEQFKGKQPVVLAFFPMAFTPG